MTEEQLIYLVYRMRKEYEHIDDVILLDELIVEILGESGELVIDKATDMLNGGLI